MALENLGDILRLPAHGGRIAHVDLRDPQRPRSLTAFELDHLIASVARGLASRGIQPGERIGILAANSLEFLASYFGTMRIGAVAVPINYRLPAATIEHIFRDADVRLVFCDAERRSLIPAGLPLIGFDDGSAEGFDANLDHGQLKGVTPKEDDLAEILYTSGSTGLPKGVPLNHHGQLWAVSNYLVPLDPCLPIGTTVIVAPLYHMNGLYFTTLALANRVTVISLPRFDARQYLDVVARYRCTQLSGIPTMFALMVRVRALERMDLTSVVDISIGSAPLTDSLLDQVQQLFPQARIHNGFGTTEAGPGVFGDHPDGRPTPPLSLGYPQTQVNAKLVDGASEDEGMLALRTPALMRGYLNLAQVTATKMRHGWYLTGDLMRRDANGFYFFLGRADDMFVCGGENIYPGEVEKMLEHHPHVAQAVVVAAPDDIKGQIPVAFIVPRQGTRPNADEIKRYALTSGPAFAHPRFVVFQDALPESGTHKIDRRALTVEATRISRAAGRSSATE
jgi:long-chain acyl-CoA synthetase